MQYDNLPTDDKELMKSKRQEAVDAAHRRAEKDIAEKAQEKRDSERYALQEQMRVGICLSGWYTNW